MRAVNEATFPLIVKRDDAMAFVSEQIRRRYVALYLDVAIPTLASPAGGDFSSRGPDVRKG